MTLRAPTRRSRPRSLVFDAILRARASALIVGPMASLDVVLAAVAERLPDARPVDLGVSGPPAATEALREAMAERFERHPALVVVLPPQIPDEIYALLAEVIDGDFIPPRPGASKLVGARVIAICAGEQADQRVSGLFPAQLAAEDVVPAPPAPRARMRAR